MEYRQAVMAIIINDDNKFLIGYSPRDAKYIFPQGGCEENETYYENVKRELYEELGIIITEDDIISTSEETVKYNFTQKGIERFNGKYIGQEMKIFLIKHNDSMIFNPQRNEDDGHYEFDKDQLKWISIKEFDKYYFDYRTETYRKALEICGFN